MLLLEGDFLDRTENVLAFGNPGSGKTHLLCALGHELILKGRRIYFTPCALLVQRLLRAKAALGLEKALKRLDKFDALIVDDIGYVQHSRDENGGALHSARPPVRTSQHPDHIEPGLLGLGKDLQGPDDHRGGD